MVRTGAFVIVASVWLSVSPLAAQPHAHMWTVQPGDALSLLAERFGTSVDQLKAWNELQDDKILIGQTLIVADKTPDLEQTQQVAALGPQILIDKANGIEIIVEEVDLGLPDPQDEGPVDQDETAETDETEFDFEAPAFIPPAASAQPQMPNNDAVSYTVVKGDTLSAIAAEHNTTLAALIEANPGLEPDKIFVGNKIRVGAPLPKVQYVVERGDTLLAIASRYDVSTKDLARWNEQVRPNRLRAGQKLTLFTEVPIVDSESVGPPNRGKLFNPVLLPRHAGYVIRDKGRAWGTAETVRWVKDAFDAVQSKFKHRKRVRVHDISDKDGGHLRDHKSHQSGRDVDISYYRKSCEGGVCPFENVRPRKLDVKRQWALIHHWLKNDQAEVIFIDYALQKPLYKYAKKRGASAAQLHRWFQYPDGKSEPVGIIRHFRKHADHLHVRFVCPVTDRACH